MPISLHKVLNSLPGFHIQWWNKHLNDTLSVEAEKADEAKYEVQKISQIILEMQFK